MNGSVAKAIEPQDNARKLTLVKPLSIEEINVRIDELVRKYLKDGRVVNRSAVLHYALSGLNIEMFESALIDLFCIMNLDDAKSFRSFILKLLNVKKNLFKIDSMKQAMDHLIKITEELA